METRPNIVLITLDTTRVDHISCYGYERETTPNIDKLAEEGHKFKRAVSTSPWTLPAHASLFTGTYPSRHGARFAPRMESANAPLHANRLDGRYATLAEILSGNGYETAGIAGGPWFHRRVGLWRGFDFKWDVSRTPFEPDQFLLLKIPALELNKIAFEWLDTNHTKPFFLFINYFDAHTPYDAPRPFDEKFGKPQGITNAYEVEAKVMRDGEKLTDSELESLILAYDNEIAYMDFHFGKLMQKLKALDAYDNCLIIVTSDHGEHFGEHDLLTHVAMVYEEALRVPFIMKLPESMNEEMPVDDYVQLTDIMPTILNMLKIDIPGDVQGGIINQTNHPIIAESFQCVNLVDSFGQRFAHTRRALYWKDLKYIWTDDGSIELYDLARDPGESRDFSSQTPDALAIMQADMRKWLSSFEHYPFSDAGKSQPPLDEQTMERLRALGYIK